MKTTKRFEYKYIITYADYFKIRNLISVMLEHDKHGGKDDYPVHSIYLDDLVFSGASDKAFGNEIHQKYRIRFYNDENKMKLELKHKIGEESTKYSTPINRELYEAILEQDLDIIEKYIDDQLIRKYMLDMLNHGLLPKVTMRYLREAYKDSIDNLRITFDHTLFGDRFEEDVFDVDKQLLNSEKMILEVKYEHYLPKEIKQILRKIKPNHVSYSKYFLGYNCLDL